MRLLAAAALCLSTTAAQQSTQPPTFRSRADLVQVDVVVVDKDGNPIRGLKAADFTLFDRKKRQKIAAFEEVSHEYPTDASMTLARALPASVKRDVADNRTARSNRVIVMVVDDLHIYKDRTDRAKDIARRILTDLGPEASMAVLFTSGDHSTQVTEDRALLAAAVETLRGRQSWRRPHQAIDQQAARGGGLAAVHTAQSASLQDFFENMTQYKTLEDAARMLGSGDARRKAFVLVSEGIGKDLTGMFEDGSAITPCDARGGGPCYHDVALWQMMESMRRSNVATYNIDPRGHVGVGDLPKECFPSLGPGGDSCSSGLTDWYSAVRQAQQGLEIMAAASGGFAVTDTDDFTSGLKHIVEDLDHYYLLGFYPDNPKGKGYRRLDVRVAGQPEWKLRFRKGYLPGGPPDPPKNANPLVALSSGVMPNTGLPLRLTATPMPAAMEQKRNANRGMKTARVAIALEVSAARRQLQENDGKLRDLLKYEILVVDEAKKKVRSMGRREGRVALSPIAAGASPPDAVSYQVEETIDLAPGRYQLRVSASSEKLASGGSVYLNVEIPDFTASPLTLSGLAVGYASGPRVPVTTVATPRTATRDSAGSSQPSVLPFPLSLDRVFASTDTLRLYFDVFVQDSNARARGVIEVLDPSDHAVQSHALPSVATQRGIREALSAPPVDVRVPLAQLAPGAYVLRVTVSDGANTAVRQIGFGVKK